MSKHTPEPWFQVGLNVITEICSFNVYENIAFFEKEEDAERVLKCVNACGGMENPAEEIAQLRADKARLIEALGNAIPYLKGHLAKSAYEYAVEFEQLIIEMEANK